MDAKALKKIISEHKKWLKNNEMGSRADLSGADLSGADLSRANLSYAMAVAIESIRSEAFKSHRANELNIINPLPAKDA